MVGPFGYGSTGGGCIGFLLQAAASTALRTIGTKRFTKESTPPRDAGERNRERRHQGRSRGRHFEPCLDDVEEGVGDPLIAGRGRMETVEVDERGDVPVERLVHVDERDALCGGNQ